MDAYTSNRLKIEDMKKNKKYADEPIHPYDDEAEISKHHPNIYCGLTKRELFAAMAMQGMLGYALDRGATDDSIADKAVKIANALINELNKQNETD